MHDPKKSGHRGVQHSTRKGTIWPTVTWRYNDAYSVLAHLKPILKRFVSITCSMMPSISAIEESSSQSAQESILNNFLRLQNRYQWKWMPGEMSPSHLWFNMYVPRLPSFSQVSSFARTGLTKMVRASQTLSRALDQLPSDGPGVFTKSNS